MARSIPDTEDEKPLDPEMEKVRRKMIRLLAVSIGIMFISLMAVLGAIVYKFTRSDASKTPAVGAGVPAEAPVAGELAVPAGFAVESMSMAGDRVALYGRLPDGSRRLVVFDVATGRSIADLVVRERP